MKTLLSPIGGAAIVLSLLMLAPETALSQSGDQEKAMYYSLYYEDFKNENYAGALQNLQWILQNAPGFPRNNDRNFERAVKVFREMAVAEEDPATRQAYFDSALVIFDTAVSRLQDANAEVSERDWIFGKGQIHTGERRAPAGPAAHDRLISTGRLMIWSLRSCSPTT